MKAQEIREKNTEELEKECLSLMREKFNLNMRRGSGQNIPMDRLKKIRRDIARIKTIITEREKGQADG